MMMFSFVEADYKDSVFMPDRNIYLSFVYSDELGKHFLYMESYNGKDKTRPFDRFQVYGIRPSFYNYKALPYKRQSSINKLDGRVPSLRANSFGFPWCDEHKELKKIRGFYSRIKKQYAVIAHTRLPLHEDPEKVLLIFDRYSDAISLILYYGHSKIKSLLGSDFKLFNVLYPYLLVEYMSHPICLFSNVGSYRGSYSLGPDWCCCLVCFLRGNFDQGSLARSIFGFIHKDRFSRVIDWNSD